VSKPQPKIDPRPGQFLLSLDAVARYDRQSRLPIGPLEKIEPAQSEAVPAGLISSPSPAVPAVRGGRGARLGQVYLTTQNGRAASGGRRL
jgi:hypothetical protein